MRTLRVALKYFTLGLLVGLLLAPRAGHDTRRLATAWLKRVLSAEY